MLRAHTTALIIGVCAFALGMPAQDVALTNRIDAKKVTLTLVKDPVDQRKVSLLDLRLEASPLFTSDEITSYDLSSHSFTLTEEAYSRVQKIFVPVGGREFVVSVGNRRVYSGDFWSTDSSYGSLGIIIMHPGDRKNSPLRISPSRSAKIDLRNDPELLEIMKSRAKPKPAK